MTLTLIVILPFVAGAVLLATANAARLLSATIALLFTVAAGALLALQIPAVASGAVLAAGWDWLPLPGARFGFRLDGLAAMFAGMVLGLGALIIIYARYYLSARDPIARFYAFFMLFMGSMLGVVLADNLILLAVFWELTSLSSFLLIGYWQYRSDARQGARLALTITGLGGLALLGGVLIIGHIVGDYSLDAVLAAGDQIRASSLYLPALILVLLGVFTKSAQFPFHFWLPHAMAAPTPVSAYLHSATMVKAGVFLLARLYPALGSSEPWFWIVSLVGLATLLVGAYTAIFQHDLKGLLAYSTISHLGLITLLFGLDEPLAVVAGVFHIINHATFKAGLFMSAGIIDHECGTRDMRRINGLLKYMPFTATLGMTAAAAMAGVPLLNGFLSKEMFFAETVAKEAHGAMQWLLPAGATLAGIFSVAYSLRFVHDVFFNGEPVNLPKKPHEAPFFMVLPVGLLVMLCLAVGLVPALTAGPLLGVAAQAALHGAPGAPLPEYTLAIWHGLNLPLLMSGVATAGGVALYFGLQRFINLHRVVRLPGWVSTGGRDIFMALQTGTVHAAQALTASLETGSLQRYLSLLVVVALAAGAWPFFGTGPATPMAPVRLDEAPFGVVVVALIGLAATVGTVLAYRRRLLAVVLVGAVGLAVCLAFVWFSAPDLALTQLLVEMATVVLLMLALRWLPASSPVEPARWTPWLHAGLALAAGLGVAALTWLLLSRPSASISDFFLANTLPLGGGSNAVNVIIVDFRAFDTLGEIAVFGIAALVMHALLANFDPQRVLPAGAEDDKHPLMLQLASRLVLPFAVLISLYMLLRGHNQPGGGFIAGLVLAITLLLVQVAHGHDWTTPRAGNDYRGWVGWGLLIAGATGVASWLLGSPFLTSTYDYPWLPGVGGVPLASAAAFDLGVYLVVVGGTMVMLQSIARLSKGSGGPR